MGQHLVVKILLIILGSAIGAAFIMPVLMIFGRRTGIVAKRQYFNERVKIVPCTGGIGIYWVFIGTLYCALRLFDMEATPEMCGILAGGLIIHCIGIYDDVKNASIPLKVIGQVIGIAIAIFFGVRIQIIFFSTTANILLTFLWLFFMSNAFNFLDILDGLAGGISAVSSLAFGVVGVCTGDLLFALMSFSLTGTLLGFLGYNYPPARIYMGDAGSLSLGFFIGAVSIAISYAPLGREIALFTPLVILGIPLFDTLFVIIIRALNRRSVFHGSKDHLALRLIVSGFQERQAILFVYFLAFLFCVNGVIISRVSNAVGLIFLSSNIMVCLLLGFRLAAVKVE
ncbi:MAG: undecaprenyl/decaprenyl-phosphate alpha-N-acetylglucosaminyl 1-phosphate transferase [Candidatus Omnitrophica bacterium]|nr:undecaprenyl/decaprenyl-phosphate alpha-N-acetylglucosaminyl 1-phosphate transferase [Candidatus Omnitrophota bacterium]